jgi:hypothetical protein
MQHRHQHILNRLPNNWKIIFVQPSLPGAILKGKALSAPINKNIFITTMPIIHTTDRISFFRRINDILIVAWSRFVLKKHHIKHPVILLYEPRFSPVIGKLGERLVWYELIDDRLGFSEVPSRIRGNMETVLVKADLITASSSKLYDMAKSQRKEKNNVFLVGNGVDYDHFAANRQNINFDNTDDDILAIKQKNQPIIGYLGSVGEWFDFDLIEKIATRFPTTFILVIGFVFPKLSKRAGEIVRKHPNVRFLGRKNYLKLAVYLNAFTASIIPFKIYDLTEAVNPTKFYEYCAAGRPVITTALPELERYQDVISYAHDHEEFLESLENIIILKTKKQDQERLRNIAKENMWDRKVQSIIDILFKFTGIIP